MNNNEWPWAVTTASIWISIGFALGFGLFKMTFTGGATIPVLLSLTVLMMGGGVLATLIVWKGSPPKDDPDQNK